MRWVITLVLLCVVRPIFAAPVLWNAPPLNRYFVGREQLFKNVTEAFQTNTVLVITGGPGFGKSQIAKQYAHAHAALYDVVWWFKADSTLSSQFEKFATSLNLLLKESGKISLAGLSAEKMMDEAIERLRRKKWRCLLVFDNVETLENFSPYLSVQAPPLYFLVTTRKKITA